MPNPIKLSAKLPKELELNGLDTVYSQLEKFGTARIIMEVSCSEVLQRLDGTRQPVLTIEHVEGLPRNSLPFDDGRQLVTLDEAGEQLINRARKDRETARGVLPGMGTDDLKPGEPYVEGVGNGAGWND